MCIYNFACFPASAQLYLAALNTFSWLYLLRGTEKACRYITGRTPGPPGISGTCKTANFRRGGLRTTNVCGRRKTRVLRKQEDIRDQHGV